MEKLLNNNPVMGGIFSPVQVKAVTFTNRIVMAPMVRFGYPSRNGVMGGKLLQDYIDHADKGIGLMISQVLGVSAEREITGGAGAYSVQHIDYLSKIAKICHKNNTRFFAQLGLPGFGFYDMHSENINTLTEQKLRKIRDWFIRGAEICQKAGLDGIELHGAHTFFLNMMASSYANKRQDIYGDSLTGRLTLVKEIAEAVKSFAGEHFILSYRMGWGEDLATDVQTAQELENIGIDMLHVSAGIPENRKLQLPAGFDYNDVVYTGCHIKKYVNIPVIAVNDIKTLSRGNELIENHYCDFAAYGKPFLADPDFIRHSVNDKDYKSCFGCRECRWFTNGENCPARIAAESHVQ